MSINKKSHVGTLHFPKGTRSGGGLCRCENTSFFHSVKRFDERMKTFSSPTFPQKHNYSCEGLIVLFNFAATKRQYYDILFLRLWQQQTCG